MLIDDDFDFFVKYVVYVVWEDVGWYVCCLDGEDIVIVVE